MKIGNHIFACFISICICSVVAGLWYNSMRYEKHNIRYNSVKVVGIGQCSNKRKSSSAECAFWYEDGNSTQFAISDNPVSIGQIVYQMCWTEKARGDRCYVNYQTSKQ